MSDIIIRAENVGKRYTLQHQAGNGSYQKLSDTLIHAAQAPLRGLRKLKWGKQKAEIPSGEAQNSFPLSTFPLSAFPPRPAEEDFWALKDVSFEVKQGEVLGIIGRNGAGKSTLLKILSRITEPTTGRITLKGRVASLLEVGTGFHPELTGRENIFLNGAILGMRRDEIKAKFDEIVDFAGVEKFLDTPVKRYSSGMYVRLAFAVAAHLEPEILIIDEVLAVGDAEFQKKCLGKMRDVAKGGRTVLFVSHNLKALEHFCTRGLLMEGGKLSLDASARDCVGEYLSRSEACVGDKVGREISDELHLASLEFNPSTVVCREKLQFSYEMNVKLDCQLHDLHLFLYNSFGERVAILDLRDPYSIGGTRPLVAGQTVKFSGVIDKVFLVDGRYRVGVAVRTSRHFLAFYDLVDLNIAPTPKEGGGPMPYAPEYQGTTLLDYDFAMETVG